MQVGVLLMLGGGFFWSLTYILIIRRGFLDRTYGMPMVGLCANLAWEFIFTLVLPHVKPYIYTNWAWLLLDIVIFAQFVKFGRSEFPNPSTMRFCLMVLATLIVSFCAVLFISIEFDDTYHGAYAAFGSNLMMSILFVTMLSRRNRVRGQSIYIAISKMLGSVLVSLAFLLSTPDRFEGSVLLPFLSAAILIFDLVYTVMVYQKCRKEGISPLKRA